MQYGKVLSAEFVSRPNRFLAEVILDGRKEIVHVKNTGRCKELLLPGCRVYLAEGKNPERKTKYDLVAVRRMDGKIFNIDSQAPNIAVKEWLHKQNLSSVIPEYVYGDSRVDFYVECMQGRKVNKLFSESESQRFLMEVKGCTLEVEGIGYFPDAPTQRGVKHLRELIKARSEGYDAIIAFVIQMEGVTEVRANLTTHPEFGQALEDAKGAGVKVVFFTCHVEPDLLEIKDVLF